MRGLMRMAGEPVKSPQLFHDHYLILQVHPEADAAMIDAAYWHLARRYNEAEDAGPSARAKLDELNKAYSVLGSSARRKKYNQERNDALGIGFLPAPPPSPPAPTPLAVMDKHRPGPREERTPQPRKRQRFSFRQLSLPPWQGAASAAIVLTLALGAVGVWEHTLSVAVLAAIGVVFGTVPLLRRLPGLPALSIPRLHWPRLRPPHRSQGKLSGRGLDPHELQQATRDARARLRESVDE